MVFLGLGLLLFALGATGAEPRTYDYYEEGTVGTTGYRAHPVPLTARGDLRLDVRYHFPTTGEAFTAGCFDYATFRQDGRRPLITEMRSGGTSGGFSTNLPSYTIGGRGIEPGCPFLHIVFAWNATQARAGPPEVEVVTSSILASLPAGILAVSLTLVGALLATTGGVAWSRRLDARRPPPPADAAESTVETLMRLAESSGAWLERTRRYLVVAGVVGVFLWYPLVLAWAWARALEGGASRPTPWLLAAGALVALLALTAVWARTYLRLSRELAAWRERVARLQAREATYLASLDAR